MVLGVDLGAVEEHLGLEVVVERLLPLQRKQSRVRLGQLRQRGGAVGAGSGLVQQACKLMIEEEKLKRVRALNPFGVRSEFPVNQTVNK